MFEIFLRLMIGAVLFTVSLTSTQAAERPRLNWVIFEQAPYFIVQGDMKRKGVGDRLLKKFMDALPGYNHVIKLVNVNRYNIEVLKPDTCIPVAWLSQVETGLLHSRAHSIEPPMGIFISKSQKEHFGPTQDTLSLATLLENKNLRLGAIQGMMYGARVEALLAQYSAALHVQIFNPGRVELNLKLLGRRVDYLLGIPSQSLNEKIRGKEDAYQFYNIQEIENYVDLFAHCSNDEMGQNVMKVIDGMLTQKFLGDMLLDYEYWYGKNALYRTIFKQHIINQKAHPLVQRQF